MLTPNLSLGDHEFAVENVGWERSRGNGGEATQGCLPPTRATLGQAGLGVEPSQEPPRATPKNGLWIQMVDYADWSWVDGPEGERGRGQKINTT